MMHPGHPMESARIGHGCEHKNPLPVRGTNALREASLIARKNLAKMDYSLSKISFAFSTSNALEL